MENIQIEVPVGISSAQASSIRAAFQRTAKEAKEMGGQVVSIAVGDGKKAKKDWNKKG